LSLGAIENSEAILFSINVFLPTIIHVYVFTMLFMIYGALKTKNKTEYIPVLLLTIVPVLIFLFDFSDYNYQLSDYVLNTYVEKTNFSGFINQIAICFSNMFDFPHSNLIYKTQIFISFIYTYHYLNWFLKTSSIGWMKVFDSKKRKFVLFLWATFVLIYAYNFRVGYVLLLLLSYLHVILEFPLNIKCFKDIFRLLIIVN